MGVNLQQNGGGGGGTTVNTKAKVTSLWLDSFTAATGLFTASQPSFTDILGSVAASQLPNPSATTLGGIQSIVAASHKWVSSISTAGVPALTQPDFNDLTGNNFAHAGFFPALAGVTNPSSFVFTAAAPVTVANQVSITEFTLPFPITINKLVYNVGTISASDKWAFGIYTTDGLTKLLDSGVISPTVGGFISLTLGTPVTLSPGTYTFAQTSSGTTATMDFTDSIALRNYMTKNRQRNGLAANASAAGVLPATLGAISNTQRGTMAVYFEN